MKIDALAGLNDVLIKIFYSNQATPEKGIAEVSGQLHSFGVDGVMQILNEILIDTDKMEEISNRSYLHGNGFYKIILEETKFYNLRLHIWPQNSFPEENIHDHRWHFASTILSGEMESEIWEDALSSGGVEMDEYLYFGMSETERAHVKYVGKSKVSLKEKIVYKSGDFYYLMANKLHRVIYNGNCETSSFVCQSKEARKWARTLTHRLDKPDTDHNYISPSELQPVLQNHYNSLSGCYNRKRI